jgi:hypothetical protein
MCYALRHESVELGVYSSTATLSGGSSQLQVLAAVTLVIELRQLIGDEAGLNTAEWKIYGQSLC